jgi:hypothetical protein
LYGGGPKRDAINQNIYEENIAHFKIEVTFILFLSRQSYVRMRDIV